MNYTIKKIESKKEKDQVKELWGSHSKVMRDKNQLNFDKIINFPHNEIYGTFFNDELLATSGITIWKKLPIYELSSHYIKKGINTLHRYKLECPLSLVTSYSIKVMEARGYYTMYFAQALSPGFVRQHYKNEDIFRNSDGFWDTNKNQFRYEIFFDEVISTGKRSNYEIFNNIIDNKLYNNDLMVFHACLKNEYRIFNDRLTRQ